MQRELVTFKTAKLAKEKGFDSLCYDCYNSHGMQLSNGWCEYIFDNEVSMPFENKDLKSSDTLRPTQSELQKFIRKNRGVHIEIHRNASGYYWSMCMTDGGTDLGWSESSGTNASGVWDEFEDALENALQVQLSYDLLKDKTDIKHWDNYAEYALKLIKN